MFRQGDVLLISTEEPPGGVLKAASGRIVLAYGEASGHAHAAVGRGLRLQTSDGNDYLLVASPAELRHEEHATIALAPGCYRVVRQREYHPEVGNLTRFVED